MEIGKLIKKKRLEKELSLRQLAELVFNNKNYATRISNIENGKTKNVTFEIIQIILLKLDINLLNLAENSQAMDKTISSENYSIDFYLY